MLQVLYSCKVHHQERSLMDLILKLERKTAIEASEINPKIKFSTVELCSVLYH